MGLDRHRRVVEHDRRDRNAAAHRGLEIEAGHAEGGVAHEVDAEFVGGGDLGADRQPEPGAELVRLAPADIAARPGRPVERVQLLARAAGIVGDDGFGGIDHPHELRDHPVGVDRPFVGAQLALPAAEPCLALARDLLGHAVRAGLAAEPVTHRLDQLAEHELGVAEDAEIGGKGLVQVARVVGRVDDLLTRRDDWGGDAVAGKAAADAEQQIGFVQDVPPGPGKGAAAGPERQHVILREGAFAVEGGHHRGLQ